MNEAAESRLVRVLQLYQFNRLRKLLNDPQNVLDIQENNSHAKLLEDNEKVLAEMWQSFLTEHDIDLSNSEHEYSHIMLNKNPMLLSELRRLVEIEESDSSEDVVQILMDHISKGVELTSQGDRVLPDNLAFCFTSETFRPGFYKGKLRSRL